MDILLYIYEQDKKVSETMVTEDTGRQVHEENSKIELKEIRKEFYTERHRKNDA